MLLIFFTQFCSSVHIYKRTKQKLANSKWDVIVLSATFKRAPALTPVGHEDLQRRVLQEVAAGEYGPDLGEQPFSMKPLGVGQNLQENTAEGHRGKRVS